MPPNLQVLLRSILSRPCPNQFRAFCSLKNAEPGEDSPENGHVVSYLVNSCGLSLNAAIAVSKTLHLGTLAKPKALIGFLQQQGFTKPQIDSIVRTYPKLLVYNPEKFVLPKIQFFLSSLPGVSKNDVFTAVSKHPLLLASSLKHKLAPHLNYLINLIGPQKAAALFRHGSMLLTRFDLHNRLIPNMDHLREIGVPASCLEQALFQCPGVFSLKHADFKKLVLEVREMGFNPSKLMFVLAMNARSGKACLHLWDRCYEVYKKWGWSRDEILTAFMKHPNCMLCSEKKITAVLEFVTRELGREAGSIAKCPTIIFFSMEKRIVPRCTLCRDLASKGLIKKDWNFSTVLNLSEEDFMRKYILRFSTKAPELCEAYASKKALAGENVAFVRLLYK